MASRDKNESAPPGFEIRLGGRVLAPRVLAHVTGIAVDLSLDKVGIFTMKLSGFGEPQDENDWIDDELFAVGESVLVRMGYGRELKTLFGGEITGLDPSFSSSRPPTLTVRGYDRSHRLQRGDKTRTFIKLKYSDIAAQVATEAKLTPQVQDSRVVHDFVQQARQSNLDFLRALAEKIDYLVMVEDKKLLFQRVANDEQGIMTLTMEKDLIDFSARLSAAQQPSEVLVKGWDMKEKKEIIGKAGPGDESSRMDGAKSASRLSQDNFGEAIEILSLPVMSQAEADQMAQARLNEISLSLVEGSGSTSGRTELRPGKVIKIAGVGERFSGRYYITDTAHRFDQQGGYRTSFSVRRNSL